MARKTRFNGIIEAFASQAVGTERTIFGEVTQSDAINDQLTADFLRGWGIVGVNDLPTKQDFNAMGYAISLLVAYLYQAGVPEWNAAQDYHTGQITNVNGVLYRSLQDNNTNHAPASFLGAWWATVSDSAGIIPQNIQNANYTFALSDVGKHVIKNNGTGYAYTIPTNAAVGFAIGSKIKIVNQNNAGNLTITRAGGVALYLAGNSTDANRVILPRGEATLMKIAADEWLLINGGEGVFGTNGYQILPSGLIVQWGSMTFSGVTTAVTYPITFPTAVYNLQFTGKAEYNHFVTSVTTSGFTAGQGAATTFDGYWMAIGR